MYLYSSWNQDFSFNGSHIPFSSLVAPRLRLFLLNSSWWTLVISSNIWHLSLHQSLHPMGKELACPKIPALPPEDACSFSSTQENTFGHQLSLSCHYSKWLMLPGDHLFCWRQLTFLTREASVLPSPLAKVHPAVSASAFWSGSVIYWQMQVIFKCSRPKETKSKHPRLQVPQPLEWRLNCRRPSKLEKFFHLHASVPHFTINIMFSPLYGFCDEFHLKQVHPKTPYLKLD